MTDHPATGPDQGEAAPTAKPGETSVGSSLWVAPNPFGEQSAFLLLFPEGSPADLSVASAAGRLRSLSDHLGLSDIVGSGEIPLLPAERIRIALRGAVSTLWLGQREWLTFPVPDLWTGAALARKYIVLVVGEHPRAGELDAEQVASYIRHDSGLHLGLVRVVLRVEGG